MEETIGFVLGAEPAELGPPLEKSIAEDRKVFDQYQQQVASIQINQNKHPYQNPIETMSKKLIPTQSDTKRN